jgi:hypothetical protein
VLWIALYVGIGVLGLAVLGALTVRLWRQVREFGRAVGAAGAKISALNDELARVSPPRRQ